MLVITDRVRVCFIQTTLYVEAFEIFCPPHLYNVGGNGLKAETVSTETDSRGH